MNLNVFHGFRSHFVMDLDIGSELFVMEILPLVGALNCQWIAIILGALNFKIYI